GDEAGNARTTRDGFQSASQESSTFERLLAASCGGGGSCVLVGERGAIVRTTNGSVAGKQTLPSGADLRSVSCPSASACYAVGRNGVIMTSADGGATWTRSGGDAAASNLATNFGWNYESVGGATIGSLDLAAASCPSATACVAV